MLQEAAKVLSSAFQNSFIKRLSLYLHDCVREEVQSSTFRNLNQDKNNKWVFVDGEESLLANPDSILRLSSSKEDVGRHGKIVAPEINELMLHADVSKKDRYLIYGYLFITGKKGKGNNSEFLTPLLYTPCKLERDGMVINCSLADETLQLNTGALAGLMKFDDEDEAEQLFEGIIDVVPDLPLTKDKVQIFVSTLKSIIPDIDVNVSFSPYSSETQEETDDFSEEEEETITPKKVCIEDKTAIILTKRPSITAGVLHELTQISEQPNGVFRETALNVIGQEFESASGTRKSEKIDFNKTKQIKDFVPLTPLALSEAQEDVIKSITQNPLVTVYGPPGTGKSHTIVNLVAHFVASGKTVLVASRMDKAVDVVTERLNELGAPYLALRAGRSNYQKQLHFQLQDLLSNKFDLDTDFEDSILVSTEDMHNLFKTKRELEKKCSEVFKLEKKWYEILKLHNQELEKLVDNQKIKVKMSMADINLCKMAIKQIEGYIQNYEEATANCHSFKDKMFKLWLGGKTNVITQIINKINTNNIVKTLKLDEFENTQENIDIIKQNLYIKELNHKLRKIEGEIGRIGNIHQLFDNLKELREKQKHLAVDILKKQRRESLKSLISDQVKRQRLMVHAKALVERKKNLQNRLLQDEDFTPLLDAFPCWAITTYSISESLPLKPGLFDIAIIDESSQCDIASCFPILFRAKKAIIVGDDKQLPHLSFLEKAKEQSFLSQHNIPDRYQLMWRFRTSSVFDIANYYSLSPIMLDEHFRSRPEIINFSNQAFYGGRMRIMNKEISYEPCVELHIVKDGKVDLDQTKNMAETEKILEKLHEYIIEDKGKPNPRSIGIISPFRGQVELIKKAVSQVLDGQTVDRHQLEIGTAHTFQGDEKDVILLSFTVAENSHFQSLIFAQKPNLFNVAITRARKKLLCFVSQEPKSLPSGLLRDFCEYIQQIETSAKEEKQVLYNNSWEEEVAKCLKEEGLTVLPNFKSCDFDIDLVVTDGENQLAVECNGVNDSENYEIEIKKHEILERCGWDVMRLTAREWQYSSKVCIDKIKSRLNPNESDDEI